MITIAAPYQACQSQRILITPEQLVRSPWFWLQLPMFLLLWPIYEMAVVTQTGRRWIIDKVQNLAPNSNSLMDWVGWGTGTNAESDGDSALQTEASEARVQGTLSQPTADTDRCVATLTANANKSISEAARFNQLTVSGSVLLMRMVFTALPLLTNDRIEFTMDHLQQAP